MNHCTQHSHHVPTCPGCVGRQRTLDQEASVRRVHEENRELNRRREQEDLAVASIFVPVVDISTPDVTPSFDGGGGGDFNGGGASGSF